ncbi:MAG: heat-inducible transcription repressor HrcA [Clostridiaceae bacterium]|nr:heat-inducible transcription repressor HrcA [Clostridiaceae bacterium]
MELGERKLLILQAIINDYIISAEPVGSRTVAKKYGMGISSATIRNEMADLEDMGYLEQPHTSAGRIPSNKAYRLYVDRLMKVKSLSVSEAKYIKEFYKKKTRQIEQLIFQTAKILSDITNYTSVVLTPQLNKVLIRRIQLVPLEPEYALLVIATNSGVLKDSIIPIPEGISPDYLNRISNMLTSVYKGKTFDEIDINTVLEMQNDIIKGRAFFNSLVDALTESITANEDKEVYLGGPTNIFNFPEYHDVLKAKAFLDLLEEKELLYKMLSKPEKNGVSIVIGEENEHEDLKECSIVTATYKIGDKVLGTMGIIGPTRMEYSRVVAVIDHMGKSLSNYLTRLFNK